MKKTKKNGTKRPAKALALNASNLKKMTPEQRKKYRKHLADVRAYVLDRREWQKKIKGGIVGTPKTLAEYRAVKHGTSVALQDVATEKIKAEAEAVVAAVAKSENGGSKAAQLERLVAELKRAEERQADLLRLIKQEVV